jgi:uncharacterized protein YbbK (DUF523 family)
VAADLRERMIRALVGDTRGQDPEDVALARQEASQNVDRLLVACPEIEALLHRPRMAASLLRAERRLV